MRTLTNDRAGTRTGVPAAWRSRIVGLSGSLSALALTGCSQGSVARNGDTLVATTDARQILTLLIFSAIGVVLLVSAIRALRDRGHGGNWVSVIAGLGLIVLPLFFWWMYPIQTRVTVDGESADITIGRDFVIRSSTEEKHKFSDLRRVHYHFRPSKGEDRAQGTVLIVLSNSDTVEVFKSSPDQASKLAQAIAQYAQVPLTES